MPEEPGPDSRSDRIGDVGAGARVAQGETITGVEGVSTLPDGAAPRRQFQALLARIEIDPSLDEDTRELARAKSAAVATRLTVTRTSPSVLRRALLDAKSWFGGAAASVGDALGDILRGKATQTTPGTVTEATTTAAVASFMG